MAFPELERFVANCLSALDETKRDVIRRRYGLEGSVEESLEAIGDDGDVKVTREAVRQRQLAALKILHKQFAQAADAVVANNTAHFWQQADTPVMLRRSPQMRDPMAGGYLLAWHVTTGGIRKQIEWLQAFALEYRSCWIDRTLEGFDEEAKRIADAASDLVHVLNKPWSAHALAEQLDCNPALLTPLLTAAFPKYRWATFAGYVIRGSFTARPRRAAILHGLMHHRMTSSIADIRWLEGAYRRYAPGDQCTARDLMIVARENKHLFLEVGSGYLSAIGIASSEFQDTPAAETVEMSQPVAAPEEASETNIASIAKLLLDEGPLRLATIMERLDLTPGTIAGTLGQNYQFVRVLPGIYAMDSQVASIDLSQSANALFNQTEVLRIYVRARYAGEPFNLFPLWGWEFEHQLALWAERNNNELLPSLLEVADPAKWPVSEDVKQHWLARKEADAHYHLGPPPALPPTGRPLEARHVLAALLLAKDRGYSSVVSCSLVMGADGLDSSVGYSLLMLLVASGCVTWGMDWQSPHEINEVGSQWIARLGEDLANHGTLDWSSSSATAFLSPMQAWHAPDDAWFSGTQLDAQLVKLTSQKSVRPTRIPLETEPSALAEVTRADSETSVPPTSKPSPVLHDIDRAAEIVTTEALRTAARNKDRDAMYKLALRTREGNGTAANPMMATHWMRLAAAQGHPLAVAELSTTARAGTSDEK